MISLNDRPLTTRRYLTAHCVVLTGSALLSPGMPPCTGTRAKCLYGQKEQICRTYFLCTTSHLNSSHKGTVTSGHEAPRFGAWSRFLNAVWMLSPCLRGPLGDAPSSHPPGHAAEIFGFILPPPLTGVVPSELELVPGRGAVIAHSS